MNLKDLFTKCLMFFAISLLGHLAVSCTDTEETDSSNFALYYYGVTDIGPSMNFELKEPSYIGGAPYDFAITSITLNDEDCSTESFIINETTGAISIKNTANLATGTYKLNISCYSNGKYYEFKNAVQINMLLAVPEGVVVTPEEVVVNLDEANWIGAANAQVTTTGAEHVSITGYSIAQDESKEYLEYFSISGTGKITINSKHQDKLIPGQEYTLSLKLTTNAGEHLYPDAVTFKVISKPRNLSYSPKTVEVDKGFAHESELPTIQGSMEDLKYSITAVTPVTNAFTIDETTGKIRLSENNNLEISETPFVIDITVSNAYGSTEFPKAYNVKIVKYTEPIKPETFAYNTLSIYKGGEETQNIKDGFVGDSPHFDFDENNSEEIQYQIQKENITIDNETGAITISSKNTLKPETYDINVKVTNSKPVVATTIFKLTIVPNPNDFSVVSYGTNIEHPMPEEGQEINTKQVQETNADNRNQFRFINRTNFQNTLEVMYHDLPENATKTFEIIKKYPENVGKFANTEINPNNGTITLGSDPFTKNTYEGGILLIKVTASGQGAPTISKKIPVFFSTPKKDASNETMIYTPIVVKANPRTGISSSAECKVIGWNSKKFLGYKDITNLVLDYRADQAFYNFSDNPNHGSGKVADNPNLLMYQIWKKYQNNIGLGSRAPMSYYTEQEKIASKPAYINPTTRQITVNLNKWIGDDEEYANGAVMAQIKYRTDGNTGDAELNAGIGVFPVFIWLDENF